MKVVEGIFLLVWFTGPLLIHCQLTINETGCGETKGCFTCTDDGDNCKADSKYVLTYKKAGEYIEFEMSSKDQWVAVGINSKAGSMVGTDTMMCVTISGVVYIHHYNLKVKQLPSKTNPLPLQIVLISGTHKDGTTTCRFKRKIDSGGQSGLKRLDTSHYLVFAYGPVVGGTPNYHKWKTTTDKVVDLQVAANIVGGSSIIAPLIKAHGSLMTIAWMCFAAISIFMARYMRLVWEDEKLFGQKVWFTVHRGLMILVIVFSTVGVILAFVNRNGWSEGIGAHPYTGIITFVLALIQPIMAFFRPHPGTDNRFLFNWAHRTVGLSALILAVVTLFLAVFMKLLDLEEKGLPILIIFCVGVVIVLIFEIVFRITQAAQDQAGFSLKETGGNNENFVEQMQEVRPQPTLSSSGRCLRLALFGFVVLVSVATSLAFVIIIATK